MADLETEVFGDLTSPSSRIASLEVELQETQHHLDCVVGKLTEAESNYERVQCENAMLHKQVALLKKELATYMGEENLQAVSSPDGDHGQQCNTTRKCDGTNNVNSTKGPCLPDWTSEAQDVAPVNIGESVKAVAEAALGLSGFVYDEATGLYYNYSSQYYYDPVNCLYYEPHSGTYYSFNQDTQTYEFHSQVDVEQPTRDHTHHHRGGRKKRDRHREKHGTEEDYYKDHAHLSELTKALSTLRLGEQAREISSGWPPCIRVMVKNSPHLQVGSLYIITCSGATVGREKELGHTILIPDTQVSKMHCDIQYDAELQKYVVRDHASQNGTLLNGHRISQPKKMSAALPLSHLDMLQVGDSQLELHIHPGTETCDGCEPGQVMAQQQQLQQRQQATEPLPVQTKADKERLRRQQLKMIKKKFGLADCAYVDNTAAIQNVSYEDKASMRRQTVGSDHPYQKDDLPASVTRAIPTENKGHTLLSKMGWKEGEGLGKTNAGIQHPIQVNFRSDQTAGLGSSGAEWSVDDVAQARSSQKWRKAQQRFDKLDGKKPVLKSKEMCWVKGDPVNPDSGADNHSSSCG